MCWENLRYNFLRSSRTNDLLEESQKNSCRNTRPIAEKIPQRTTEGILEGFLNIILRSSQEIFLESFKKF